ncbi:MAG: S1 RNA-binding domain-containing protein [Verrucomicrobia bacterium]|nr:S1 RNA-binding domain-containing protein [Verrucomicrobiota bacterium]
MTQNERAPEPSAVPEAESPATPQHPRPDPQPAPASDVVAEAATSQEQAPPQNAATPAPAADPAPEQKPAGAVQAEGEGPKLPGRGEIVEVTVRRLAPFGAFVRLADGRKGLIHISQVADAFVEDIKQHLEVGQTVRARITSVLDDGKVDLSIKKAKPRPKPERPPRPKRERRPERDRDEPSPQRQPEQFRVNPLSDALGDIEKRLK